MSEAVAGVRMRIAMAGVRCAGDDSLRRPSSVVRSSSQTDIRASVPPIQRTFRDGHARQVIGHYGCWQCSRSGRPSIENTPNPVCKILNRILPLTFNMIGRLRQTPGFPDEQNFIHRRQSPPESPCEMKSEFSETYFSPVEHWRASLLQPFLALQARSPRLLYRQRRR